MSWMIPAWAQTPKFQAGAAVASAASFIGIMVTDNPVRPAIWSTTLPLTTWYFDSVQKERKRQLFKGLRGRVLELSPGIGLNFDYYNNNTKLEWSGIEPNEFVTDRLEHRAAYNGFPVSTTVAIENDFGALAEMKDASVDAVVSTMALGRVDDVDETLRHINRVLKPGGQFYFVEYTAPSFFLTRALQSFTVPFTYLMNNGVCKNRPIAQSITTCGFEKTHIESWPGVIQSNNVRAGVKLVEYDNENASFKSGKAPKGVFACTIAGICVKKGGYSRGKSSGSFMGSSKMQTLMNLQAQKR